MKNQLVNLLNLGVLVHAGGILPVVSSHAATSSNPVAKKVKTISDEQIVAMYAVAMKSKDVEDAVSKTTAGLLESGVTDKKIESALKKALLKFSPEIYAEVNTKIKNLKLNSSLSDVEKTNQLREITAQALLKSQQTGLSFTSNCNPEAKVTAAIVVGIVAIAGGITALVLNRSDASIKKKYDGRRQDIIQDYNNTKYSIENAEYLLLQENQRLLQSINNIESEIRKYENEINDAEKQKDIITHLLLNTPNLTEEQRVKYQNDFNYQDERIKIADDKIEDARNDIHNITVQIAKNGQKILYYSDPANVEFELNQAKIDYDLAVAANDQDYQNALANAPGNRRAAKWVGIGSAVTAGVAVTLVLMRNAGCDDH